MLLLLFPLLLIIITAIMPMLLVRFTCKLKQASFPTTKPSSKVQSICCWHHLFGNHQTRLFRHMLRLHKWIFPRHTLFIHIPCTKSFLVTINSVTGNAICPVAQTETPKDFCDAFLLNTTSNKSTNSVIWPQNFVPNQITHSSHTMFS